MDIKDYPLWHGFDPMREYAATLEPGRFLVSGEGVWVTDADGKRYLDARSCLMNVTLGYDHPRVVEAIAEMAAQRSFPESGGASRVTIPVLFGQ